MIRVPKSVRARQVDTFTATRRALFERYRDPFAELLADGLSPWAAARKIGMPPTLAAALLQHICDMLGPQAR